MAVQFLCPSCQQPIEVDDNWAGQSVACPYCKHVVTAPRQSGWPAADVPMASPARSSGFEPPPPPPGYAAHERRSHAPAAGPTLAAWALSLAIMSAVLWFLGMTIWYAGLLKTAMDKLGTGAPPEQLNKMAQELLVSGAFPVSNGAVIVLTIGIICGMASIVMAVQSQVRKEGRHVKVIIACMISLFFIACQGLLLLVVNKALPMPATHPSAEIHYPSNAAESFSSYL